MTHAEFPPTSDGASMLRQFLETLGNTDAITFEYRFRNPLARKINFSTPPDAFDESELPREGQLVVYMEGPRLDMDFLEWSDNMDNIGYGWDSVDPNILKSITKDLVVSLSIKVSYDHPLERFLRKRKGKRMKIKRAASTLEQRIANEEAQYRPELDLTKGYFYRRGAREIRAYAPGDGDPIARKGYLGAHYSGLKRTRPGEDNARSVRPSTWLHTLRRRDGGARFL